MRERNKRGEKDKKKQGMKEIEKETRHERKR